MDARPATLLPLLTELMHAYIVLSTLAAALLTPDALAKEPKPVRCGWRGDAVDPISKLDTRALSYEYRGATQTREANGSFSWTVFRLGFHHTATDGSMPLDVSLTYFGGALQEPFSGTVSILLANGTVLQVAPSTPVAGALNAAPQGITTAYEFTAVLPPDQVTSLAGAEGVSLMRTSLVGKQYDVQMKGNNAQDFVSAAKCALQ